MRAHEFLGPLLFIALGCGGAGTDSGTATGGQATGGNGKATGGSSASGGSSGTATSGGSVASGGNATGGTSTTSGGTSTTSGGTSTTTGGSATTTGGAGGATPGTLVDCDLRKVVCRVATPSCPAFQVPSVNGTCYGPCTPIADCACTTAAECPDNDQYTCWGRMHCGPYVD